MTIVKQGLHAICCFSVNAAEHGSTNFLVFLEGSFEPPLTVEYDTAWTFDIVPD